MRYLLEIIAAVAAQLAGKDQALTENQIFPNSTYPGAVDPAAVPGAQSYQKSGPFYPSPWMSGQGDWASAYAKAKDFVSQLTLLEKVNLTTGVGWEGEQCVGQVFLPNSVYSLGLIIEGWIYSSTRIPVAVYARFACRCTRHGLQQRVLFRPDCSSHL